MNRIRIFTILALVALLLSLALTVTAASFRPTVDIPQQNFPWPARDQVQPPRINIIDHSGIQLAGIDTTPRHP